MLAFTEVPAEKVEPTKHTVVPAASVVVQLVRVVSTFPRTEVSCSPPFEMSEAPETPVLMKVAKVGCVSTFTSTVSTVAPSPATASLWIVNPFRGSSLMELFSTHPSTEHRVERLRKIGEEMGVYVP